MFSKKSTVGLMALAFAVSASAASICTKFPARQVPVHGTPQFGNHMCSDQIDTCSALCGSIGTSANTCTSDNNGDDNPFQSKTYCYECVCADDTVPNLAPYWNTIPHDYCVRVQADCEWLSSLAGNWKERTDPAYPCVLCGPEFVYPSSSPSSAVPASSTPAPSVRSTASASDVAVSSSSAGAAASSSASSVEYTTSTVYSTSTYTVTKCPATVTNCPVGKVTTEVIAVTTTVCPVSEAGESTPAAPVITSSSAAPVADTHPGSFITTSTTAYSIAYSSAYTNSTTKSYPSPSATHSAVVTGAAGMFKPAMGVLGMALAGALAL
ncbi:hypothetical protein B0H63DRAFT_475813 [Podospora didyma]|uniref:DUF7707 domain-containing protein n=1 Tax=Podospora didyma TaxID=330526 RepID=A0AAE0NHE5_9PEZI|nr:hypothetical protein B0H63DRAFT_475813 [Podospora didyma]